MNIIQYVYLFVTVFSLCVALFVAFSPYEWICKIMSYYKKSGQTCQLRHGVVTFVALGFFLISILASKEFKFVDTLSLKSHSIQT
jgi:hypothetical protein